MHLFDRRLQRSGIDKSLLGRLPGFDRRNKTVDAFTGESTASMLGQGKNW